MVAQGLSEGGPPGGKACWASPPLGSLARACSAPGAVASAARLWFQHRSQRAVPHHCHPGSPYMAQHVAIVGNFQLARFYCGAVGHQDLWQRRGASFLLLLTFSWLTASVLPVCLLWIQVPPLAAYGVPLGCLASNLSSYIPGSYLF